MHSSSYAWFLWPDWPFAPSEGGSPFVAVCVYLLFLFHGMGWNPVEVLCHPVCGPLLSPSTLESQLAWVIPTRRVAMDTSLLCLRCSGTLPTCKVPVPKLIDWR